MYCRYCGAQISDDSLFCSSCGRNIGTENDLSQVVTQSEETVESEWFYRDDFQAGGPLSYEAMEQKIKNREIDFDGEVRSDKDEEWIPLTKSIFSSTITELPARKVFISDKWIWCLAILPLIVPIILNQIGILTSHNTYNWVISVCLNALFLILDKNEIEKEGLYSESWSYLGIILVPLYLIVREVKTNHNYSPAIVYSFILAVDMFIL